MRYIRIQIIMIMSLMGCFYEAPLTTQASIGVDPAMLGVWKLVPEAGETLSQPEVMTILEFSDHEYMIRYDDGPEGSYFRAYPIQIGGISCVQLQLIGSADGPISPDEKGRYIVASFTFEADRLVVRTLNTELVSTDLKTSQELVNAFVRNKSAKNLFTEPGFFINTIHEGE